MNMKKFVASAIMVGIGATGIGTAMADDSTESVVFLTEGSTDLDMVYIAHLSPTAQKEAEKTLKTIEVDGSLSEGSLSGSFGDTLGMGISLAPDVYLEWADEVIDSGKYINDAEELKELIDKEDFDEAKSKYIYLIQELTNDNSNSTLENRVTINVTDIDDDEFEGQAVMVMNNDDKPKSGGDKKDNKPKPTVASDDNKDEGVVKKVEGKVVDEDEMMDSIKSSGLE